VSNKIISANDAADIIKDGDTISTVGMTLASASESILKAIENKFLEKGTPNGLSIVHAAGQSDRDRGIQHFAHEKMLKRIIGSHWGLQPKMMELIGNNKIEAYCLPQGQITHLYRSMAEGLPGQISKVGLGTFIDPRIEGGKMNDRTMELDDISQIIDINDEEYIFYQKVPLDVCIIRGTVSDEDGNITANEEAMKLEVLPAVLATKRFGGKVIAQVKRVAESGTLNPRDVVVPGVFVDKVVVSDNPYEDHRQTSSWYYDPSYSGQLRVPESENRPVEFNVRKFIGRRASQELEKNDVVNLGTGIPNDVIGNIVNEEGVEDDILITVESGIYGGTQAGGIDFGIGRNLSAMITHHEQMDYYNGTGVDVTFMGFGELDESGNINATKMGNISPGAGGFIDITQNAKKIVFTGTFTASGGEYNFDNNQVTIMNEGKIKKMVSKVKQLSFNGSLSREKNQEVIIVTERAVFELVPEGVLLKELAPGIDLQTQVLDLMDFDPIVDENLKTMDDTLFNDGSFNLKKTIK